MLTLIEHSSDPELLLQVTEVTAGWLTASFSSPNALSIKDRAMIILKMACFEAVPSRDLHAAYLQIVYQLHVDPTINRPELLERIEPAFMFGLRTRNTVRPLFVTQAGRLSPPRPPPVTVGPVDARLPSF